ncbi:hypothetical protein [Heyndrickxia acidicola]|uniref:Uncharacterized protein n=1 Tax=Heyndrickxia acidicola TaxID=209389 RepID=A0ABU6MNI4_9BACI|nr:hypothetical protein [Heyndrickxia acidicola]MED1205889.1 hypothetical protein [Heyndrickxia acidicola]
MAKKELFSKFNKLFDTYRVCKFVTEGPEAEHNPERQLWKDFCVQIENAVNRLPDKEKEIILERYMKDDYVFDKDIYGKFQISPRTYDRRKADALTKIAYYFEAIGEAI